MANIIELNWAEDTVENTTFWNRLRNITSSWKIGLLRYIRSKPDNIPGKCVEDYRSGYPRFSALVSAHSSFHLCRRFTNLRVRQLLLKQDKLSSLEKQLEKADVNETRDLFLGNCRRDENPERKQILLDIDTALCEYDSLVERNHRMLALENAKYRHISSLQNWLEGNGCIARAETAYLQQGEDLVTLASTSDNTPNQLEAWVEHAMIWISKNPRTNLRLGVSRDPHIYIFPTSLTMTLTRMVVLPLITLLLLAPIVICNALENVAFRIAIILVSTGVFLTALSALTKARSVELFLAGTTYAAVLVVFVEGFKSSSTSDKPINA